MNRVLYVGDTGEKRKNRFYWSARYNNKIIASAFGYDSISAAKRAALKNLPMSWAGKRFQLKLPDRTINYWGSNGKLFSQAEK